MPTYEQVQQAVEDLAQRGETVSIEKVRALVGGSTRDLARHLRAIRAETAPHDVTRIPAVQTAPALTLADIRDAAKRCLMQHLTPSPQMVLYGLTLERQTRYTEADLWHCLLQEVTTGSDQAVMTWQVRRLAGGSLVWTTGNEARALTGIWQRLIVDPIGQVSAADEAQYRVEPNKGVKSFIASCKRNKINGGVM